MGDEEIKKDRELEMKILQPSKLCQDNGGD
jgi:hypothetical protein